jgi:hypothetical protein
MDDQFFLLYLLLLYAACGLLAYYAQLKKSFLFMLYAAVFAYIGTTYWLFDIIDNAPGVWFLYLLLSCGGFVYFIIRFKHYFKRIA